MRLPALAAIAVLVLSVAPACRRETPEAPAAPVGPVGPVRTWKIPEKWSTGQGERNGKPIFTRFNVALKPFIGRPEFAHMVGIDVPLNHPTPDGLPTGAEAQELRQIEDEIGRRFLPGNESLFAGVITTSDMREFILYTTNPRTAMARAAELARDTPHHRIHFVVNGDPQWENFKTFAAGL